jgi:hypothetical protein
MKRSAPLRRRKRPNPVGRKAEREREALAEFRQVVLARTWCEARGLVRGAGVLRGQPVCSMALHRGDHAHHVVLRSQGGGHDPSNGLLLCAKAHAYAHDFIEDARALGLLGKRLGF